MLALRNSPVDEGRTGAMFVSSDRNSAGVFVGSAPLAKIVAVDTFPKPKLDVIIGASMAVMSAAIPAALLPGGPNMFQIRLAMFTAACSVLKPPSVYVAPPMDRRMVFLY